MAEPHALPLQPGRSGRTEGEPGLRVREHRSSVVASLLARRGDAPALDAVARRALGVTLPRVPRWAAGPRFDVVWNGPEHWLIESRVPTAGCTELIEAFDGCAAVVDQTDSRIMLDVSGPRVRDVLAKGVPIDLHETQFRPGDVALTSASHIGVQLRQLSAEPAYRLAIARSYFASFWHWLAASAAQYGCEVSAGPTRSD